MGQTLVHGGYGYYEGGGFGGVEAAAASRRRRSLAAAARQEVGDYERVHSHPKQHHASTPRSPRSTADNTPPTFNVVVTRVSESVFLYPVAWAAIGAILMGALVSLLRPDLASRTAIVIQLSSLIVLTLLLDWLPDPSSACAQAHQACARSATCPPRIQCACAGSSESTAPNPVVRVARRALSWKSSPTTRLSALARGRNLEQNRR